MSRLVKTTRYCLSIGIVGVVIGIASGAIGICGGGGWGVVPAVIGSIGFVVGIACLLGLFIRYIYRKLTA